MSEVQTAPSWNPFDPEFLVDPYPTYARLRDEDPVHRTPIGTLLVSRYDDVHQVLRDTENGVLAAGWFGPRWELRGFNPPR